MSERFTSLSPIRSIFDSYCVCLSIRFGLHGLRHLGQRIPNLSILLSLPIPSSPAPFSSYPLTSLCPMTSPLRAADIVDYVKPCVIRARLGWVTATGLPDVRIILFLGRQISRIPLAICLIRATHVYAHCIWAFYLRIPGEPSCSREPKIYSVIGLDPDSGINSSQGFYKCSMIL